MRKWRLVSLLLAFLLVFTGCGKSRKKIELGYDIPYGIRNLDPQFADDTVSKMVLINIFEGLVVQAPDGKIYPGAAEKWTISADQLEYTFLLRDGIYWSDDTGKQLDQVTSSDFQFAFQRIFNAKSPSPHADKFLTIKNAKKVLIGELPIEQLGVSIVDDRTITFYLETKDDFFLEKLASPAAMPCHEKFFIETKGRYGLDTDLITNNGPFNLVFWDYDDRMTIQKNKNYIGNNTVSVDIVDFFVSREDPMGRFKEDITDVIALPKSEIEKLGSSVSQTISVPSKVWCLGFRNDSKYWGVPTLRQGLAYTLPRKELNDILWEDKSPTSSIYPPAILIGGIPIEQIQKENVLEYDLEYGKEIYQKGLGTLDIDRIPSATIIYSEDEEQLEYITLLQKGWKTALNLHINISGVESEKFQKTLEDGTFEIALFPMETKTSHPDGILQQFSSTSNTNYVGFYSTLYDEFADDVGKENTIENMAVKARSVESILLTDAIIIPLYTENTYYALGKKAKDIEIYPESGIIRFQPVAAK